MKIVWQTQSRSLYQSFCDKRLPRNAKGGHVYNFYASMAVNDCFGLLMDPQSVRGDQENILAYWRRVANHDVGAEITIKDPYLISLGNVPSASYEIAVIHHIDDDLRKRSLKYRWYFRRLEKRLTRLDCVVTVSEYWRERLRRLGCNNTKVIYNSFDLREFSFSSDEISQFRFKYNLNTDKPLIYIGNAQRKKGVVEAYNSLGTDSFGLVMSGPADSGLSLPVLHLDLGRREYLLLLNTCDVVLTMSRMIEGWNRTAHEAMLCGTPVIGTGVGGMKELLVGGRQLVQTDFNGLPETVRYALANKDKLGSYAFEYAAQFDLDYFRRAWQSLIRDIISARNLP